jgi:phage terminase large subunit GpA-like protein
MATCEQCGNDYDKAFQITMGDETRTFDSFECAIQAVAPRCAHCECRIIGHGVESEGVMYCCAHCAGEEGVTALRDRE